MNESSVVIFSAPSADQAYLVRNMLAERGIEAEVVEDSDGESGIEPQVVVSNEDATAGRAIVDEFHKKLGDGDHESETEEPTGIAWKDWPRCPTCERQRQAICPVCETAGTDFPLAEFTIEAADVRSSRNLDEAASTDDQGDPATLLICPNCDESFAPRFYRHCEDCGHDFGVGVQVSVTEPDEFNYRIAIVLAALLLLGIGALGYFWMLLN